MDLAILLLPTLKSLQTARDLEQRQRFSKCGFIQCGSRLKNYRHFVAKAAVRGSVAPEKQPTDVQHSQ